MQVGKWKGLRQLQSLLELVFRLAGKAYNDVRSDGGVRESATDFLHPLSIIMGRVRPVHPAKHIVRTTLHGQVKVFCYPLPAVLQGFQQATINFHGLNRAQTEALHPSLRAQRADQAGQRSLVIIPPPDTQMDTGKHDLLVCLLYTSDAADDLLCVDLGGRRIIKKKKK